MTYNPNTMINVKELCWICSRLSGFNKTPRQIVYALKKHKLSAIYEKTGKGGFKAYSRTIAIGIVVEELVLRYINE